VVKGCRGGGEGWGGRWEREVGEVVKGKRGVGELREGGGKGK
jgi:hypothetical protein